MILLAVSFGIQGNVVKRERERGKNGAGFKKLKSCKFYEIIRIENVQCDIITKKIVSYH